ncbi:MAG: methyltransferase domain-containing protein [Chromatiales bacterium]|jgi:sarcosine/dimethylglycine N-methyltransferase|nr:methyltransferase domain-containing protein [Chromatiales bacterium]
MGDKHQTELTQFYDTHPINEDEILAKVKAQGADLNALSQPDLQDLDQDHYGGTSALDELADLAGIRSEHHVLDVCSGMGGPARWLAFHRQCRVTGLDFTQTRVEAARRLSERVKLAHLVDFVHGDAMAMSLPSSNYHALISQESWLHVPDKAAVVSECVRVTKPGGVIAFTDIVTLTVLDSSTEARLASGIRTANLASAEHYRTLLTENGCSIEVDHDLSEQWKNILTKRLEMFRSLRDTTVAKFGEARFNEYDAAYAHYVNCFVTGKLGGIRIVARTHAA